MTQRPSSFFWFVTTAFSTFFCWALLVVRIDPDFGWRLRHGMILMKKGFITSDPFSYTMPSYPFISHAWSFDLLLAYLSSTPTGLVVFALVLALAIQGVIATQTWKHRFGLQGPLLTLAITGCLLASLAIRAQVVGWLLFAFALWLVLLPNALWQVWRWGIPTLSILWANLHGSFLLLPFLLLIRWIYSAVRTKSLQPVDLLIALCPIPLSLLNPYGNLLWLEVWQTLTDTTIGSWVQEWLPLWKSESTSTYLSIALIVTAFTVALAGLKKEPLPMLILLAITGLALQSVRHLPLACITALYVLNRSTIKADPNWFSAFHRDRQLKAVFLLGLGIATALISYPYVFSFSWSTEASSGAYPKKATTWLRENIPSGNIFAPYGWGGYLIEHSPEHKLFIDGRMPSWNWEAPPNELDNAAKPYLAIRSGNSDLLQEMVNKFSIVAVISPKLHSLDRSGPAAKAIGWKAAYEDAEVIIFTPGGS